MIELKTVKYYPDGWFWVSGDEVGEWCHRLTHTRNVGETMRELFPCLCFFRKGNHWGYKGRVGKVNPHFIAKEASH